MFNMMGGRVAIQVAMYMGLDVSNALSLWVPTMCSKGCWRLPYNALPCMFQNNRGLPPGMATSVLLSELHIAPLLWRISACWPLVSVFAYVDQFEEDFSLSLSVAKTKVLCTNVRHGEAFARESGLEVTHVLGALGAQWRVNTRGVPQHPKETQRLKECILRLQRARVVPLRLPRLALIISTGCLELLDFVNLPDPKPYGEVRTLVKSVLGCKAGLQRLSLLSFRKAQLIPSSGGC